MTPDSYKKSQILFGRGGGFTNLVNEYHLLENTKLFYKQNRDSVFTDLGKQNADTTKLLFAKTRALFADTTLFHQPGNTYYFIKLQKGNKTQEMIWGNNVATDEIVQKAKDLYKELMNLVNLNK